MNMVPLHHRWILTWRTRQVHLSARALQHESSLFFFFFFPFSVNDNNISIWRFFFFRIRCYFCHHHRRRCRYRVWMICVRMSISATACPLLSVDWCVIPYATPKKSLVFARIRLFLFFFIKVKSSVWQKRPTKFLLIDNNNSKSQTWYLYDEEWTRRRRHGATRDRRVHRSHAKWTTTTNITENKFVIQSDVDDAVFKLCRHNVVYALAGLIWWSARVFCCCLKRIKKTERKRR